MLSQFLTTAEVAGDASTTADVRQLQALCDSMDKEAFLPLTSEEHTSTIGRRIVQFGALPTDLMQALVGQGWRPPEGLRAAGSNGWYGRYFLLLGHGALLYFDATKWAGRGDSPSGCR